ncbi:PIN domain-containing protein [Candidatus Woesearchaeota archaeon]|nr:PIN domain-containing protein [Candidatus Woesearchaeota archaeon]
MDLYEDRKGFRGEPLGRYAAKLISMIMSEDSRIVTSDIVIKELRRFYSDETLNSMFRPFQKVIDLIFFNLDQHAEATEISKSRNLPKDDVLHAILSRDSASLLIARDKHFKKIRDITYYRKPESLI